MAAQCVRMLKTRSMYLLFTELEHGVWLDALTAIIYLAAADFSLTEIMIDG